MRYCAFEISHYSSYDFPMRVVRIASVPTKLSNCVGYIRSDTINYLRVFELSHTQSATDRFAIKIIKSLKDLSTYWDWEILITSRVHSILNSILSPKIISTIGGAIGCRLSADIRTRIRLRLQPRSKYHFFTFINICIHIRIRRVESNLNLEPVQPISELFLDPGICVFDVRSRTVVLALII